MKFIDIKDVKLGNMRKAVEWTVTPGAEIAQGIVTMQSDNRIARLYLNEGYAVLSDGKNGHQGFQKLSESFGAKRVPLAEDVVVKVRAAIEGRDDYKGPIRLV